MDNDHRSDLPMLVSEDIEARGGSGYNSGVEAESSRRHSHRSRDDSRASFQVLVDLLHQERLAHQETKRELTLMKERLRDQMTSTNEAENKVATVLTRLRSVNEERVSAVRETSRLNESLALYRFQLEKAQNEIHRAQTVFELVEKDRYNAEVAGVKSRTLARQLHEQQKMYKALEEGRRQGAQQGFEAGQRGYTAESEGNIPAEASASGPSDVMAEPEPAFERPNSPVESILTLSERSTSVYAPSAVQQPIPVLSPIAEFVTPPASAPTGIEEGASPAPVYVPFHDIRPIPIHNSMPHPHEEVNRMPIGVIPVSDPAGVIHIPPAHEVDPIAEATSLRRSGVVVEPTISPSAFARALSPGPRRPLSVAGSAQSGQHRTPAMHSESIYRANRSSMSSGPVHISVQSPSTAESSAGAWNPTAGSRLFDDSGDTRVGLALTNPSPFPLQDFQKESFARSSLSHENDEMPIPVPYPTASRVGSETPQSRSSTPFTLTTPVL